MDSSDPPPRALIKHMNDDSEVKIFESFKSTTTNELHPGFTRKTLYDDQRAIFRPPPST